MDICFRTLAILFLLFSATSCAPGPCLQDAWAAVRTSALELHRDAKQASAEARKKSTDIYEVPIEPAWIEAKDQCDPESLKRQPQTCLRKILSVSMSYSSSLKKLSEVNESNERCAKIVKTLMQPIQNLNTNLEPCVNFRADPVVSSDESSRWQNWLQCDYTLERLLSFSIFTARVFAVGNPAHHAAGRPQKCT